MADSGTQVTDDRRTTLPEGGEALSRPKGRSLRPLALLWPYVRRHWITVCVALVFLIAASAVSLAIPMLLGRAADAGQSAGTDAGALIRLIDQAFLWVFAAAVGAGVLGAFRFYFVSRFGERIAADLRRDLYAHLLRASDRQDQTAFYAHVAV